MAELQGILVECAKMNRGKAIASERSSPTRQEVEEKTAYFLPVGASLAQLGPETNNFVP